MTIAATKLSAERYRQAAGFTAPKFAPHLSGSVRDGYWLDEQHYFYVHTQAVSGVVASIPMLADVVAGQTAPILSIDQIAAAISSHSTVAVESCDLADCDYAMPDAGTLVVTFKAVRYRFATAEFRLVEAKPLDPEPALFSPDGRYACLLKDQAIWLRGSADGTMERLSPVGEPLHAYGRMLESGASAVSSRRVPMPAGLWSRNSEWFVTHLSDERHLPDSGLLEHVPSGGGPAVPHVFKVATPADQPPRLEIVAFHIPTGRMVRAGKRPIISHFISPFMLKHVWFEGERVYFFDVDRHFSDVALVEFDLASGRTRTVMTERVEQGWIDLHPTIGNQPLTRVLPESNEVIWHSSRSGFGHLYLHDLETGALKATITGGAWMVREIVHIDEDRRRLLFLASGLDERDLGFRSLCAANFDGSGFERLVHGRGDVAVRAHVVSGLDQMRPDRPSYAAVGVSPKGGAAVLSTGDAETPTRFELLEFATGRRLLLGESDASTWWRAPKPRPFEVLAADGVTRLFGVMLLPSDFDEGKSYPLVDYIYPGPQMNWFQRRFPNGTVMLLQSVVELGMIGIVVESRGLPFRSNAFHHAGRGQMHEPQLGDHAAAIEQLCVRHRFIDRGRVGLFGMSGGGYATARALFDYPDMFAAGVAICGNHDNRNYVAHWLDKYGGRPGTVERDAQSNTLVANKLEGKLLLVHGDMDENVNVAHTLALSAALIAAGKPFDQLIVPNGGHGVLLESGFVVQRLWDFFARHLLGAEPPTGFHLNFSSKEIAAAMQLMVAEVS